MELVPVLGEALEGLPRNMADATSLEILNVRLDKAFKGPFKLKLFYDSQWNGKHFLIALECVPGRTKPR